MDNYELEKRVAKLEERIAQLEQLVKKLDQASMPIEAWAEKNIK